MTHSSLLNLVYKMTIDLTIKQFWMSHVTHMMYQFLDWTHLWLHTCHMTHSWLVCVTHPWCHTDCTQQQCVMSHTHYQQQSVMSHISTTMRHGTYIMSHFTDMLYQFLDWARHQRIVSHTCYQQQSVMSHISITMCHDTHTVSHVIDILYRFLDCTRQPGHFHGNSQSLERRALPQRSCISRVWVCAHVHELHIC